MRDPETPRPNPPNQPLTRRTALAFLGAAGTSLLVACGDSGGAATVTKLPTGDTTGSTVAGGTATTITATATAVDSATPTPGETGGPFPSDGSNDDGSGTLADVLHDARAVRRDIRSDLDGSNTQDGLPLTLRTRVVSKSAPLAGAAVYVWHCNRDGAYSDYNSRMLGADYSARSFLRGVQVTDSEGWVEFQTILPGRYMGRAFHIHFEVFGDESFSSKLLTSQMAMDDDLIDSIYSQAAGYETALRADTNNAQDNIFSDGVSHQLLTVTGDPMSALTAEFTAVV